VTKQNMRFVQIKSQEQLDIQAMHRVRDRLVRRTALINEIRGFLLDRLTFAARPIQLRKKLPSVIEGAEQNLSSRLRWLLDRLWQEWKQMEMDIKSITEEIERIGKQNALCQRLRQIPTSARRSRPQPWLLSATGLPSAEDATSQLGWESCRDSTPPRGSRSCSA
jgi:transposase